MVDVVIYVDHSQFNRQTIERLNAITHLFDNAYKIKPVRHNISIYDHTIMHSLKAAPNNQGRTFSWPQVIVRDEILGCEECVMEAHASGHLKTLLAPVPVVTSVVVGSLSESSSILNTSLTISMMFNSISEENKRREQEDQRNLEIQQAELRNRREEIARENERLAQEKARLREEQARMEEERARQREAEAKMLQDELDRIEGEKKERMRQEQVRQEESLRLQKQREEHQASLEAARLKKRQEEDRLEAELAGQKELELLETDRANKLEWLATNTTKVSKERLLAVLKAHDWDVNAALEEVIGTSSAFDSLDIITTVTETEQQEGPSALELEMESLRQENALLKTALGVHLPAIQEYVNETNKSLEMDLLLLDKTLDMSERRLGDKQAVAQQLAAVLMLLGGFNISA